MKLQGLSSDERIKSKKEFQNIFSRGNVIVSADNRIKALYIIGFNSDEPGVKIAAAVTKKAGNAVWRNRVKRVIKEAFRLNKSILTGYCIDNRISLKMVFTVHTVYKKRFPVVNYCDIMPAIVDLMTKVREINK